MKKKPQKTGDRISDARADVAADSANANTHYNLGLALLVSIDQPLRTGSLDAAGKKTAEEAEECLKRALKLAWNHGRAHIMLGMTYRFTGRATEALPHFEIALGLPPDSDDWLRACDGLASCQMLLNDAPAAIQTLRLGIKNQPKDAMLHFKLGACLVDQGDLLGAAAALESAIALKPDYPEAHSLLAQVRPPKPPPPAPGAIDYVAAAKETERLGKELTEAFAAILQGPGTPEEKTAKTARLQAEYQRKVKALYGA